MSIFDGDAPEVAPRLLGGVLSVTDPELGTVRLRLTEVEAYAGERDPGSHAFRGLTPRNAVMFGPAGRLYTYFTYGMHVCANLVTGPEGRGQGVLLRAGEVVGGLDLARLRRPGARSDAELARGPARLTVALGITLADGGTIVGPRPGPDRRLAFEPAPVPPSAIASGPRTGVSGAGGTDEFPWRFWLPGEPTVSPYRAHRPRARP